FRAVHGAGVSVEVPGRRAASGRAVRVLAHRYAARATGGAASRDCNGGGAAGGLASCAVGVVARRAHADVSAQHGRARYRRTRAVVASVLCQPGTVARLDADSGGGTVLLAGRCAIASDTGP